MQLTKTIEKSCYGRFSVVLIEITNILGKGHIYLSVYPCIYLFIYLSTYLYLDVICMLLYLSIYVCICISMSIYTCIYSCIYHSICPSQYLSLYNHNKIVLISDWTVKGLEKEQNILHFENNIILLWI